MEARKGMIMEEKNKVKVWDVEGIKKANALRRLKGKERMDMIAAEAGVVRVAWAGKVWYDGYPGKILKRPPNKSHRILEVRNHANRIVEESGTLIVDLKFADNFYPRDEITVEPHPHMVGKWQLVGEYNFKGKRIG